MRRIARVLAFLLAAGGSSAFSQAVHSLGISASANSFFGTANSSVAEAADTAESSTATQAATPPVLGHRLDRWLDLNAFNYGTRYRSTFNYENAHTFNQGQQKLIADGKFKFDSPGRFGLGFHLSSGRYFNWAYADFIGGGQHQFLGNAEARFTPLQDFVVHNVTIPDGFFRSGGGQVYLRQLYLDAAPIQGIEVQFGGLAINHGTNTEATSYDDDGYMSGERISVRKPRQVFFSELSYTRGYVGDLYTPNFFARGYRLATANYWQILGRKDFRHRLSVSADYTSTTPNGYGMKANTTREGIWADVHETRLLDSVRFEAYQRLNTMQVYNAPTLFVFHDAKGYALTLNRSFGRHFEWEGGIADIDPFYFIYLGNISIAAVQGLCVNGDSFGMGNRYFVRPSIPLTKSVSLTGFYTHIYHYSPPDPIQVIWNAQALNAGIVIDAKKLFFPGHAH